MKGMAGDTLIIAGAALAAYGVAQWSVPVALVMVGVFMAGIGIVVHIR